METQVRTKQYLSRNRGGAITVAKVCWLFLYAIYVMSNMGLPGQLYSAAPSIASSLLFAFRAIGLLLFFDSLIFLISPKQSLYSSSSLGLIAVFAIYVGLSGVLATTDISLFVKYYWQLVQGIVVMLGMVRRLDAKDIIGVFAFSQSAIVLLSILFAAAFPGFAYDISGNFVGLYTTKNTCAYELAFGMVVFAFVIFCSRSMLPRLFSVGMLAISVFLMVQTDCVGAWGTLALVIIAIIVMRKKGLNLHYGSVFLVVNLLFALVVLFVLPQLNNFLAMFGKDITLTGRTNIWSGIAAYVSNSGIHALIGAGYNTFWNDSWSVSNLFTYYYAAGYANVTEAMGGHNLFAELVLNIGLVGALLFACMFMLPSWKKRITFKGSELFFSSLFMFVLFHGLVERTFSFSTVDTVFLLLLVALFSLKHEVYCEKKGLSRNCDAHTNTTEEERSRGGILR